MPKFSTIEEFQQKVELKRTDADEYDLSRAIYVASNKKIEILHKICGETLWIRPNNFLGSYQGCKKCANKKKAIASSLGQEEFLRLSIELWGEERFDRSEAVYVNSSTKVILTCNVCQRRFSQDAVSHLKGIGCGRCKKREKLTPEKFLADAARVHGNDFTYPNIEERLIGCNIPIDAICNTCNHLFHPRPDSHIKKKTGCPKCKGKIPISLEEFNKRRARIHGDKYSLIGEYVNYTTKVHMRCNSCSQEWNVKPHNHIDCKTGCPRCAKKRFVSIKETNWLDKLEIPKESRNVYIRSGDRTFNVDAFHDGIVYEYYGTYYHGDPRKYDNRDFFNKKCQLTMGELYDATILRYNQLIDSGFAVKFIWERDYDLGQTFSSSHPPPWPTSP